MLKIAWDPIYKHSLPEGHRFPMIKYELIPEQLLYEGSIKKENLFSPEPVEEKWILKAHHPDYWEKLKQLKLSRSEERKTGFPLSKQLVERETIITQGTVQACHFALQYGLSMNVAGGTHHAFSNRGEGFCLLNDMAVAAHYLLENDLAQKILIVDLDVHQGNGTAEIFQQDPRVFTFSMHGAKNYPLKKEKSDLDIALEDGTGDEHYLRILAETLPSLIASFHPDFIFYLSGVDVLEDDKLGRLALSVEGCKNRDKLVLEWAWKHQLPSVISMGGGYNQKLNKIIEAHANTFRLAHSIYF